MKNKSSIRERRDQQAADKKKKYQQREAEKKESLAILQREEEKKNQEAQAAVDFNALVNARLAEPSSIRKSYAKAAGLKSNFILNADTLLMTSFGRGNHAIPEKEIHGRVISDLQKEQAFTATEEGIRYRIDGRIPCASTDNPFYRAENSVKTGDDLIHCRAALEERFFGRTFEDNIHIQLIYNILDMEKILAVHINNIVYVLSNLLRMDDEEHWDLIGNMRADLKYDKFKADKEQLFQLFCRLAASEQLSYYGIQVIPEEEKVTPPKRDKDKTTQRTTIKLTEREFFDVLCLLAGARQMLAHGNMESNTNIYRIERLKNKEIPVILSRLYKERIDELNNGFLDKAKKNLVLLFNAFGAILPQEKQRYVQDYYDFTVRKTYKNQGFSVKKLRETITLLVDEAKIVRDQQYDTVRQKVNAFFDFALYRYYHEHAAEADDLVAALRACLTEEEKGKVYCMEARRVWPRIRELILGQVLPKMSGNVIKSLKEDPDVSRDMLKEILLPDEASYFSEFIYLMTLFLNGKEINDLLTSFINKLENIGSFLDVLKERDIPAEFRAEYGFFSDSWKAADELRAINSFAHMRREIPHTKKQMLLQFREAAELLGYSHYDEAGLSAYIESVLDTGKKNGVGNGKEMGARNFLINNVIESQRFLYLARYANIKKIGILAKNHAVVSFVLKDIPDAQILRYWNACEKKSEPYAPSMREDLAARIAALSFEDLSDIRNNDKLMNQAEQEHKRSMQALVRLYLTVLYLAVKNLVNINSRYFLAFHCVERDRLLYDREKWKHRPNNDYEKAAEPETWGFAAFATAFLQDHPQKPRVQKYLTVNRQNSDDWSINAFRNKVEHLGAVRNIDLYISDVRRIDSWFDLYHYLIQRSIMDQFKYDSSTLSKVYKKYEGVDRMIVTAEEMNPKTFVYFDSVRKYKACCKDFIKALCFPFAYNLPRYKNLTIDGLFDKNISSAKGTGKD